MKHLAGICASARLETEADTDVLVRGAIALVLAPKGSTGAEFHRHVVSWCKSGPFLPAPFGVTLSDTRIDALTADAYVLLERLADVERRAEVLLSVTPLAQPHPADGRGYLRAQADLQASRTRALDALTSMAANDNAATLARKTANGLDVSFLVSKSAYKDFMDAVRRATAALRPTHDITLTGPSPPYSFSRAWIRGYA